MRAMASRWRCFILRCGRIGNFVDGQIVGRITTVPWAVKFHEADGFRHPVVLYDGLKNVLLVPATRTAWHVTWSECEPLRVRPPFS